MSPPTVSAVIPVYNGADYVAEAIQSVLDQTLPVTECIVIDDGSTDATGEVVGGFDRRVRYIRQANGGVSSARNHGARVATGRYVAFLDHDDRWLPEKLERQLGALAAAPGAVMGLCGMTVVDGSDTRLRERRLRVKADLVTGLVMFDGTEIVSCSSCGLIEKGRFDRLGGFDERLGTSADWDLLLRAALLGEIVYVDTPLVLYRVHGSNMSRNIHATEIDMRRAFDLAFAGTALPASIRASHRRAYARLYRMLAGSYRDVGDLRSAVRTALTALRFDLTIAPDLIPGASRSGRP